MDFGKQRGKSGLMRFIAVILCAGVGSRMGSQPDINKCAMSFCGTSAIGHTVKSLSAAGVKRIVVVVGHAEQSVREALMGLHIDADIMFVRNEKYDFHGCNYSVACGVLAVSEESNRLIIAEGDSLLHSLSIQQVVGSFAESAALVRSPNYVDHRRSVIAIGIDGKITRYAYDQNHAGKLPELSANESIIGESMQLWSFSGTHLKELRALLLEYKKTADSSMSPRTESGVYSINMLKTHATPIMSTLPNEWININTQNDLEKAKVLKWTLK